LSSSVLLVGVSATGSSLSSPQLVNNTSEQRILKNRRCLKFLIMVDFGLIELIKILHP